MWRGPLEEARNAKIQAQTLLHPVGRDDGARLDVQPRRRHRLRRRHAIPNRKQSNFNILI